ncbi:MAG: TfuA-like protein [Hyphomicrobiales bacterium]
MTAIIFSGPTLSHENIGAKLDATCRPPAAQGDVYRAALEGPDCIGIIDGYFNGVPSVWHKEILWAMNQGIAVFGSASMGALRAAELHQFGMIGIGEIFEDYRMSILEDDDEVAVIHAPEEMGYAPLSVPMVNVRATLARAVASNVLSEKECKILINKAKIIFYQERTWESLFDQDDKSAVLLWLCENEIDLKRQDAIAMLKAIDAHRKESQKLPPAGYEFEHTHLWESLTSEAGAPNNSADDKADMQVLEELRLDKSQFDNVWQKAERRSLALQEFDGEPVAAEREIMRARISTHMQNHRLSTRQELVGWIEENGMSISEFENLIAEECMAETAAGLSTDQLALHVVQVLKRDGFYAELAARATAKNAQLSATPTTLKSTGLTQLELMAWYFNIHRQESVPDDLEAYAKSLGLDDRQQFYAIVIKEYLYVHQTGSG